MPDTTPTPPPGFVQTDGGLYMPVDLRADALSDLRHPTAWLTEWSLGGRRVSSGVAVSPQTSLALAAYYACIRVIAEDCAKLPLQVLERLERGRRKADDHWLWPILHDEANDDMSAITCREVITHHAVGWGNGYGLIQRNARGQATGIYPVHPSRVTPRRDARVGLVYDIRHGRSSGGLAPDLEVSRVRAEDMLHIKGLGPDGLIGYSPCQLAAESLGLSLAAQEYGAAFFGRSATPSGILTTAGTLGVEGRKNVQEAWEQSYGGGPGQANKTAVLEQGLTWSPVAIPPEQAQFLETRQFQIPEVARWFRMQLHKIADLTNAHHSNIESQNHEHVTDTMMPWHVRWEQELDRKFLRGTPYYTKHDVRALLRGDSAARAAYFRALFMIGAASPNDIRELEDLNPYEGGDEYFLQLQYAPVRKIVDGTARQVRQPLRPRGPEGADATRNGTHPLIEDYDYAR